MYKRNRAAAAVRVLFVFSSIISIIITHAHVFAARKVHWTLRLSGSGRSSRLLLFPKSAEM
ncbi:hypothetical protein CJI54_01210 [Bifidobacteriaceae bacterium NR026]|nr:hypothetical protein CJI54_01210 [Bifidobacteriaceae bacterium NR026]